MKYLEGFITLFYSWVNKCSKYFTSGMFRVNSKVTIWTQLFISPMPGTFPPCHLPSGVSDVGLIFSGTFRTNSRRVLLWVSSARLGELNRGWFTVPLAPSAEHLHALDNSCGPSDYIACKWSLLCWCLYSFFNVISEIFLLIVNQAVDRRQVNLQFLLSKTHFAFEIISGAFQY